MFEPRPTLLNQVSLISDKIVTFKASTIETESWCQVPQFVDVNRIVLSHHKRKHIQLVAQDLECSFNTVNTWLHRWESGFSEISECWNDDGFKQEEAIFELLSDASDLG